MKFLKANNGFNIPVLGYGTFQVPTELCKDAVKYAIKCGYRHIDCAWIYQNESEVGQALNESISESNGSLKREDFYLVSKVWSTFHSKSAVQKCLDETLNNLQTDYIDLYLVHWPMGFQENTSDLCPSNSDAYSDVHYIETYKAMEELVKKGKIKSIGVSNFNIEQLQNVLDNCDIKPVTNQIEVHPYLQNEDLLVFCRNNDILITAYSPLGGGKKPNIEKGLPILLEDKCLKKIGNKHNKSAAQVCLRWAIQRGVVVLVKSVTPSRILEDIQIFNFELSDEEMNEIRNLNQNQRLLIWFCERYADHPLYPFK